MPYIVSKHPGVKMDLVVLKEYWPKMAGIFQRTECTYESEEEFTSGEKTYIRLNDIQSNKGFRIGSMVGLFYAMEWDSSIGGREDNFYILLNPRRRKKQNVHKHRKETGAGSQGGDQGEPAGDI